MRRIEIETPDEYPECDTCPHMNREVSEKVARLGEKSFRSVKVVYDCSIRDLSGAEVQIISTAQYGLTRGAFSHASEIVECPGIKANWKSFQ